MVYQKEVSKVLEECKSSVNGLTKEQVKEHREIFDAIAAHDAKLAEKLTAKHIENARASIMQVCK